MLSRSFSGSPEASGQTQTSPRNPRPLMRRFTAALLVSIVVAFSTQAADLRFFEDAALHAVQFIDREEGWAVGDEGVVWHTIDGGKNWERQPSGTRASLCGIWFVDPFTGFVVGKESLPHRAGSA